jgi:hypothetical protein
VRALGLLWLLSASGCGAGALTFPMDPFNNSGQSGFAQLTDTGGGLEVKVQLLAGNVKLPHLAHFHTGRCGEIGKLELFLPDTQKSLALRPLESQGEALQATTVLSQVKLRDLTEDPQRHWVINVHDPRDFSLYVACGDL